MARSARTFPLAPAAFRKSHPQYSRFVEQRSGRLAPAARHHVRAFRDGIGDMGLDLRKRGPGNQRSDLNSSLRPVTHLQTCYRSGELGREGVMDAALNIDAVGADAGLPRVAEFGDDRAFNGFVEICIVKHDERRIAPKLETQLLDPIGTLTDER